MAAMPQNNFHVAVIMDGNGRWATRSGLPRVAGHRAGAQAFDRIVETAPEFGISILSAYAFSADNWRRPQVEVDALMALLAWQLDSQRERMLTNGIRVSIIGRRDRLLHGVRRAIDESEQATRHCERLHLRIAVDYSSREAIQRAALEGPLAPAFEEQSPPVDLLIRTGGEQRLSDFLLWECAYAELLFVPTLWPDFGPSDLRRAVAEFHRRDRRFGGLSIAPAAVPPEPTAKERWLR
jgi:undecaprenyl diphosphate synthase